MHNYVIEPMSYGRLYLAGESAHLVAPIAAKGMNLALNDALLLVAHYGGNEGTRRIFGRVPAPGWHYQEFSQWMSDIFHSSKLAPFQARMAQARLRRLLGSRSAAVAFSRIYLGLDGDL